MISKIELKKQLTSLGIKIQGNFIKREDVIKMFKSRGDTTPASFEKWFRENKNSEELKQMYDQYCTDCREQTVEDVPVSFKEYSKEYYECVDPKELDF